MNDYYFVSDLHLGYGSREFNKEKEDIFLRFLDDIKEKAKEIFIVGDLFDFWIEYREVVPKGHFRLLNKIYELTAKGIRITYFAGNHDFWKGNYFKEEFGIEIVNEPVVREINGRKFYISHGDGLAYKDTGYRFVRKILRNRVCQFLYSWLHPDIGIWLAKKTSSRSRDYTSTKNYTERDGMRDFAKKKISEGFDYVILGHRHFPVLEKYGNGFYINLGDWIRNYSYCRLNSEGIKLIKYFDLIKQQYLNISEGEIKAKVE